MSGKVYLKLEKYKQETWFFLFSWDTTASTGESKKARSVPQSLWSIILIAWEIMYGDETVGRPPLDTWIHLETNEFGKTEPLTLYYCKFSTRLHSKQWCNKWTMETHWFSISCFLDCRGEKLFFLFPSKNIKTVRVSMMRWLYAEIVLRQQFSIPFLRWIKLPTEISRFCVHINLFSFITIYHSNNYNNDSRKANKAFPHAWLQAEYFIYVKKLAMKTTVLTLQTKSPLIFFIGYLAEKSLWHTLILKYHFVARTMIHTTIWLALCSTS